MIRSPFETGSPNRAVLNACPSKGRVEDEPGDHKERNIAGSRPLYTVYWGHGALDLTVSLSGGQVTRSDEEGLGPGDNETKKEHGSPYSEPYKTAYLGSGMLDFVLDSVVRWGMGVRIASQRVPQRISVGRLVDVVEMVDVPGLIGIPFLFLVVLLGQEVPIAYHLGR